MHVLGPVRTLSTIVEQNLALRKKPTNFGFVALKWLNTAFLRLRPDATVRVTPKGGTWNVPVFVTVVPAVKLLRSSLVGALTTNGVVLVRGSLLPATVPLTVPLTVPPSRRIVSVHALTLTHSTPKSPPPPNCNPKSAPVYKATAETKCAIDSKCLVAPGEGAAYRPRENLHYKAVRRCST